MARVYVLMPNIKSFEMSDIEVDNFIYFTKYKMLEVYPSLDTDSANLVAKIDDRLVALDYKTFDNMLFPDDVKGKRSDKCIIANLKGIRAEQVSNECCYELTTDIEAASVFDYGAGVGLKSYIEATP